MIWAFPMKEIFISIFPDGAVSLTPVDMDGTTHHPAAPTDYVDAIIIYYGATASHLENGNVCIKGNRLIVDVDLIIDEDLIIDGDSVMGLKCLVVKVIDTSGEE